MVTSRRSSLRSSFNDFSDLSAFGTAPAEKEKVINLPEIEKRQAAAADEKRRELLKKARAVKNGNGQKNRPTEPVVSEAVKAADEERKRIIPLLKEEEDLIKSLQQTEGLGRFMTDEEFELRADAETRLSEIQNDPEVVAFKKEQQEVARKKRKRGREIFAFLDDARRKGGVDVTTYVVKWDRDEVKIPTAAVVFSRVGDRAEVKKTIGFCGGSITVGASFPLNRGEGSIKNEGVRKALKKAGWLTVATPNKKEGV